MSTLSYAVSDSATMLRRQLRHMLNTMAIARVSVLTGHVLGSMIQTMFGMAVVIGRRRARRVATGGRPHT